MASIDITVLGGLSIEVEYSTGYEDGECGYPGHYIEEWYITAIAGRTLRKGEKADWLYKRIAATKGTEDKIVEACLEHAADDYDDSDDRY